MDKDELIKFVIGQVNSTLSYFDPAGVTGAARTSIVNRDRCKTLDIYVQNRFNYECYKLDELHELEEELDGRLFICTLEGTNAQKRVFKKATMTINRDYINELEEFDKSKIDNLCSWLGGNCIEFTHKNKRFKYNIKQI